MKSNCEQKSINFSTSQASTKAWYKTRNLIDQYYNVLDYNKTVQYVNEHTKYLKDTYGIDEGNIYTFEQGGKKVIPNTRAFHVYDAMKGIYYPDNQYLIEENKKIGKPVTSPELSNFEIRTPESLKNEEGISITKLIADKLYLSTGVPYEMITSEDASELLKFTKTPYTGASGFYYGNKLYFVKDKISTETVLHEYGHPIIKSISVLNPKLFNNLYDKFTGTLASDEIIDKVKELYPELEENSDRFKEEVLVSALEEIGTNKLKERFKTDEGLKSFIDLLLYSIRKLFEMISGKSKDRVSLSKLDENTTLQELSSMMLMQETLFQDIVPNTSDYAEFKKDYQELAEALKNVNTRQLTDVINKSYAEALYQLSQIKNSPYKLKNDLLGKNGSTMLRNIKDYLKSYQTITLDPSKVDVNEVIEAIEEKETEMRLRAIALVNSISEMKVFASRIEEVLDESSNKKNHFTNEGISKIRYFKEFLLRQKELLKDIKKGLALSKTNPMVAEILDINNIVNESLDKIKTLEKEAVKELFVENTAFMHEEVKRKLKEGLEKVFTSNKMPVEKAEELYEEVISNPDGKTLSLNENSLNLPKASVKKIEELINEYFAKKLDSEAIEKYINGEVEDLGILGSTIVPFMSVDDPIGSYARHIKIKMSKSEQKKLNDHNIIIDNLLPLLKAVGYDPNKTGQLGKMLLFTDKIGIINNNEVEEFEVYSFLNKFKNYRFDKAKLQNDFEKARQSENKEEIRKALKALWEFEEKYMHRKYKPEYYKLQDIWKTSHTIINPFTKEEINIDSNIATDSFLERQKAIDELVTYKNINFSEYNDTVGMSEHDAAQMAYEQLYNIYDENGQPKTGDELKKVLVRQKYRIESKKFYEYVSDTDRVQQDLSMYISELAARNITKENNPEEYDKKIQNFIKRNFRIEYTSQYYQRKNEILNELKAIKKTSDSEIALELADLYYQRFRMSALVVDNFKQTNALYYKEEQKNLVKNIEEKIVELESKFDKKTGLTEEQLDRLNYYEDNLANNKKLLEHELEDYNTLSSIKNKMQLSPIELKYMRTLLKELAELNDYLPTDYYIQAFNAALGDTEVSKQLTYDNADTIINDPIFLAEAFKNENFRKWFNQNHIKKKVFNPETKEKEEQYVRTRIWTVVKPSNEEYISKTVLNNPVTGEQMVIAGVPGSKYSRQKVKNEYRTIPKGASWDNYVGTIIDNRGNFLPRDYNPSDPNSAFDDKYINKEYLELERSNNAEFRLLKAITKSFLDIQKDKPGASKLYLDLPRFRQQSNLELIQSGKAKEDFSSKVDSITDYVKSLFKKSADDPESAYGFNADVEAQLVSTDLQGQPISRIPVRGLYKLKKSEVSQDVLRSFSEYMSSLYDQEVLLEEEPMAKAILDVFNDPENAIKEINKVNKQVYKTTGQYSFINKKGTPRRTKALEYFIEKIFYGQTYSTFEQENPFVTKVANMLMNSASRSFIAMDMVSAFKNRFGMIFQNSIEAAAGEYMNISSAAKGRAWSFKATVELTSKGIYTLGSKSLNMQLMEAFDPITGKTDKDFGKSTSRTFIKDLLDMTWMYDPRRLMEVEAGLQVFGGMMYHKKVEQIQPDGSVKKIDYIDAWEKDANGQLKLKDGINPEWSNKDIDHVYMEGDTLESIAKKYSLSVDELKAKNKINDLTSLNPGDTIIIGRSKMFSDFKLKIQGVGKKLNGMTDKFDSPQAEKYLAYRLFTFYKKYATGMFLNRFQADMSKNNRWGHVYNWDLGTTTRGYYITAFLAAKNILTQGSNYWAIMSDEEKIAFRKVIAEGMYLALLAIAITFIFGYDPGDEDRFDKMRDRQKDNAAGWLANQILYQLIMVKRENESFIPLPMVGMDDWIKYGDTSSIVFGPTIKLYGKIMSDLFYMITGDEKGMYKQDAGPYSWQSEGSYKLWNHIGSVFGIKGKNYDPIQAIKASEQFENLK